MDFYLFIYFFCLILTSLLQYCIILFVELLIMLKYKYKRLAQDWTTHKVDASIDQCIHDSKRIFVPKADIWNIWH